MTATPTKIAAPTPAQSLAVESRGNVLVMAGAGTGKTKTLIDRCLHCLEHDGASVDELLIVTFTEAAAAEMRERLRKKLEEQAAAFPDDLRWAEELARFDLAHIGTLHSFCLKLVREHFYELGLDPQLAILDEGESRQLANETLDEQLAAHYEGKKDFSAQVQELIEVHGGGRDENIRKLILRLHKYSQARPDAVCWLAEQRQKFAVTEPTEWQSRLGQSIQDWRTDWLPILESVKAENAKAAELVGLVSSLTENISREAAAKILDAVASANATDSYPKGKAGKLRPALGGIFEEAQFLFTLAEIKNSVDPLAEDWSWVRSHMETLLRLAEEFGQRLDEHKRADGVLDFNDLEQFSLRLLWDATTKEPTEVAKKWRAKLKFIFVDEYQDINAAQDKIIQGLSHDETSSPSPLGGERVGVRGENPALTGPLTPALSPSGGEGEATGNRFLVGDVKQSIYRFRLADPRIFRDYARDWHGVAGRTIPLSENFRSREGLLNFVNSLCTLVMREEIGGIAYDEQAALKFGAPATRAEFSTAKDIAPRAELLIRLKAGRNESREDEDSELAGLDETQREARLVGWRLQQLITDQHEIFDDQQKIFRPVEWRDMAILLRATRGKSEIFAKEFERAGIPLAVARGGFYQSAEILDLMSLLRLLDNPLQDVPCIAVLRSPFVGLSLDELAEIRLAAKEKHFWTALNHWAKAESEKRKAETGFTKVSKFLERFSNWRKRAKQISLSQCLDEILAETLYSDWLRAQPRGEQRAANVSSFLQLAQSFDQFQRQGLFRFLKFIKAQEEAEVEPEVSAAATENAVRLMSIHQSKGLEFPVVVLADLAKRFNQQDLSSEIIFDEELGLCPKVKPPSTGRRYPSLTHWLAQQRQKRELRGEELRLLYVALTRARDNLILTASLTEKNWDEKWKEPQSITPQKIAEANSFADWLALWFATNNAGTNPPRELCWRVIADEDCSIKSEGEMQKIEASMPDATALEMLRERLEWNYPSTAAITRKAKSSVTALRREAEELDDESEQFFSGFGETTAASRNGGRVPPHPGLLPHGGEGRDEGATATRTALEKQSFHKPTFSPKSKSGKNKLSASEIGLAHHKFLQHVALEKTDDIAAEADRLLTEHYLSEVERAALDLAALKHFWDSDLGKKIRANATAVRRELPFTARFSTTEIEQATGRKAEPGLENEFIVVQGVADLAVLLPDEIWLVDFKTDDVAKDDLENKIKTYAPQIQLYALALEKIFLRKVTLRTLYFLAAQKLEMIAPPADNA